MNQGWTPTGYVPPPLSVRVFAGLYQALFARKAFYRLNQLLLTAAIRGMCVTEPMLGPGEQTFLRRVARIGHPTVFDVGAHVGAYSACLMRLCASARIWAFEPHPGSFERLFDVAGRSGFVAINAGLSDRRGKEMLYDYEGAADGVGSPHASLHREVIEDTHGSDAIGIEVDVTTVDDVLTSSNIDHLSLLKVDAEGHELTILKGARRALLEGRIDLVQFEFNEMNVVSRVFFKDFYEALPGFTFYRMVIDGLAPVGDYRPRTHEIFSLHNIVAIRDGCEYGSKVV
jgi:FkbM family methyltransferase